MASQARFEPYIQGGLFACGQGVKKINAELKQSVPGMQRLKPCVSVSASKFFTSRLKVEKKGAIIVFSESQ